MLVMVAMALAIARTPVEAATNATMNFQARLQTNGGGIVPDGYYNVQFKLYNAASAGTNLWTETYYDANGATAGSDNRVRVRNGYLSVSLGSQTAFPGGLNWDQEMWLTMNIGGMGQTATPTWDGEMDPRLKLTGVPYAFRAGELAKYSSVTGFNAILQLPDATVGNQTFVIPDQGAAGNYNLLTSVAADADYIQNGTSPQTADFNITGDGTIGGNLTVSGLATFGTATAPSGVGDGTLKGLFYNDNSGTDDGYAVLGVGAKESGAYAGSEVQFGYGNTSDAWTGLYSVGAEINNTADSNSRTFYIWDNVADDAVLKIISDGSVGIGTGSPLAKLNVQGTVFVNQQFSSATAATIDLAIGDYDTGFDADSDGVTDYLADGVDTLRLSSSGLNVLQGALATNSVDRLTSGGALQNISGYTQSSGNFVQSGAGTFGTGTGAVSLNGDVTVASGKNLTLGGKLNNTIINKTYVHNADSVAHNYHIATLPLSTFATHDHLRLTMTLNSNWYANSNAYIDATFANREGFVYQYSVSGAAVQSCATLKAYDNAGYVDIYISMTGSCFSTASYTILESQFMDVYAVPADVASPSGSLVFDASAPGTYKPVMTTEFDGDTKLTGELNLEDGDAVTFGATGDARLDMASDGSSLTLGNYNAAGYLMLQGSSLYFQDTTGYHTNLLIESNGKTTFSNRTDATDGFKVQTSTSQNVLSVDTQNKAVTTRDLNVGEGSERSANRLFSDGFESGSLNLWHEVVNGSSSVTTDTTTVRNGKRSLRVANNNGSSYVTNYINGAATTVVRGYVYVASQTAGTSGDVLYLSSDNGGIGAYRRTSDGLLRIWNDYTSTSISTTGTLTAGQWHKIEVVLTTNATTGAVAVYLNGTQVLNATNIDTGSSFPQYVQAGDSNAGREFVFYLDDIVVDTLRPGDSANLNVNDSLHVAGTSSFGGAVLFQPASDAIKALQIQNSAGTSDLFVADTINNRIGIGTDAPRGDLDLGVDGATLVIGDVSQGGEIQFGSAASANSIGFNDNGFNIRTSQSSGIRFYTDTANDLTTPEFVIDSAGNVFQNGAGTFATGTGDVSLNGDTTLAVGMQLNLPGTVNDTVSGNAKIFLGTGPDSSAQGSLGGSLASITGYGQSGEGIVFQYGGTADAGGLKLTDDGVTIWGAGDEDFFQIIDEDNNQIILDIEDDYTMEYAGSIVQEGTTTFSTGTAGVFLNADTVVDGNLTNWGRMSLGGDSADWFSDVISGVTEGAALSNDGMFFAPVNIGGDSDLRLYITDDATDVFSIWGNSCATDCGDINAASRVAQFAGGGDIILGNLAGTISLQGDTDITGEVYIENSNGIVLDAADRPIITRAWDAFTSGDYTGAGRWGMFMEPTTLTLGVPNESGNGNFQIVRYNADSSIGSVPFYIRNDGNVGIGDTNPDAKLTVAGTAFLYGGDGLVLGAQTNSASTTEGTLYYDSDDDQLKVYANGKWQADRSTATKIVAASDSQNKEKADFVAAGTSSDEDAINAALTSLPAGGGTVTLLEGTYVIDGPIRIQSNVTLAGAGYGTVIRIRDSHNTTINAIENFDPTNGNTGIVITGVRLDGNRANQTAGTMDGIQFERVGSGSGDTAVSGATVRRSWIEDFRTRGIYMLTSTRHVTVDDVSVMDNDDEGIVVSGSTEAVTVTSSRIQGNDGSGILVLGDYVTITGNLIEENGTAVDEHGVMLDTGAMYNTVTGNNISHNWDSGVHVMDDYNVISGNMLRDNGDSIQLETASYSTVAANTIYSAGDDGIQVDGSNNSITGNTISVPGSSGITLRNAISNTVSGNTIDSPQSTALSGIVVDPDSDNNIITSNRMTDTAGTGYAIDINSALNSGNYLADNYFSGTGASSIRDLGTGTVYANQVKNTTDNNIVVQAAGNFQVQNSAGVSVLSAGTLTDSANMVTNGSFEADTTGWSARSGTASFARVTTQQYHGSASLQFQTDAVGEGVNYAVQLSPSTTYTFTAFVRTTTSSSTSMVMGYAADGSTESLVSGSQQYSVGGWRRITYEFTTPGTVSSSAYAFIRSSSSTSRTFYIDAVAIVATTEDPVYADGAVQIGGVINSPVVIRPLQDTTHGLLVQSSVRDQIFVVNTLDNSVTIGSTASTVARLNISTSTKIGLRIDQIGAFDILRLTDSSATDKDVLRVMDEGAVLMQNATDSVSALQVLNAAGSTTVLNVDTSNGRVGIGNAAPTAALDVSGEIKGASFSGAGLSADCDASGNKLLWDLTTKQFSCGTDRASVTIRKPADESVNASTTMQDDDDFTFAVGANETWAFEIFGSFTSNTTADMKWSVSAPAGATCRADFNDIYDVWNASITTCGTGSGQMPVSDTESHQFIHYGTVVTGGTAGNVTLRWAQFAASGTSTVQAGGHLIAYKISGADLAEAYYTNDMSIQPGDVVAVDGSLGAGVKKTAGAYDNTLLGVVSTKPGMILADTSHATGNAKPVLLALNGRVPVKVSDENGPIRAGDFLTASSTPGVAMRASSAGMAIGTALAGYDGEGTGTVMVFVRPGFVDPAVTIGVASDSGVTIAGELGPEPEAAPEVGEAASDESAAIQTLQTEVASLQSGIASLQSQMSGLGVHVNTQFLTAGQLIVGGDAVVQGGLEVMGDTTVHGLTVDGHLVTKGVTPVVVILEAAGRTDADDVTATVSIAGTDMAGTVRVLSGADPEGDLLVRVTFHTPYSERPRIVLTPEGKASAMLQAYIEDPSTEGFIIGVSSLPVEGGEYRFTYQVLQ